MDHNYSLSRSDTRFIEDPGNLVWISVGISESELKGLEENASSLGEPGEVLLQSSSHDLQNPGSKKIEA